jgi:hypothetical protein
MSPSDTAAQPDGSTRRLWQHADFLKLLAGETISDIGSQVGDLALPLAAALVLNATPGQMAALRAAEYVPRIAVGLVAGVWVDRLRRRPLPSAAISVGVVGGLFSFVWLWRSPIRGLNVFPQAAE